jgi:succinate-semialdehyde dehydrogenase / glutarate-semialdehyde dehydrogenase
MSFLSVNPATGQEIERFDGLTGHDIENRIARADAAFRAGRRTPFTQRARWLHEAAAILEAEKQRLGELMTREMGKPIAAAIAEAEKCAWACRWYADNGELLLEDQIIETDAERSFVRFQPLGVVLAVMPWNFPFWQVFRFAAPALMAGNSGLLKHASSVPRCALEIESIFLRAGFPEGAFQTLLITPAQVEGVLRDPRVCAATLTGSEAAGAAVAATAGAEIKPTLLELGGSDPFIVMPSADLERAVATAVTARTINNGQSCIAAKRFIVHEDIYNEFERRFVEGMQSLVIGDPLAEATQIGPLATRQLVNDLHDQVCRSIDAGARLIIGGHPIDGEGNFYAPTVLAEIAEGSAADVEELFGPVAALFRVRDIAEAILIANRTSFGLGSSAWTRDDDEQRRFIDEIEAGAVFINAMVASDPRLPFGGIKRSGYGRELGAPGIRAFVNMKTVSIAATTPPPQPAAE